MAVYNGVLGVVEKDVTVGDSEQIPNMFVNGSALVSKCDVAANFDNVCVESCPVDENGLETAVINSESKCECVGGAVIKNCTVSGKDGSSTTEKCCGCAEGSVFDPVTMQCVKKCPDGYVINLKGFRCIRNTENACGAVGVVKDGACTCDTDAGFTVATEIVDTTTRQNADGECVCKYVDAKNGGFINLYTTKCVIACPKGATTPTGSVDNQRCECLAGQSYNETNNSCGCADGEKYDSASASCVSECPAYEHGGECVQSCASNGLFVDIDGVSCVSECPAGAAVNTSSSAAVRAKLCSCAAGYAYSEASSASECVEVGSTGCERMAIIDGRAVCTTAPCSGYANFDGLECVVTCASNLYEVVDNGEKRCALDCAHWYYANVHGKCTRKSGWLAAAIVCPIIVALIIIVLVIILLISRKRQRELDIMRM